MAEPLYDQLRTKEQLGYSVSCALRVTFGVLGFCVTAQSAAYGPAHLYRRIRAFMKSFHGTLVSLLSVCLYVVATPTFLENTAAKLT